MADRNKYVEKKDRHGLWKRTRKRKRYRFFFFFFSLMYAHFVAVDTKWKRKYLSLAGYVSQFLDMRVFVCPLEWFIDDANKADMAQYTDTHWHIVGWLERIRIYVGEIKTQPKKIRAEQKNTIIECMQKKCSIVLFLLHLQNKICCNQNKNPKNFDSHITSWHCKYMWTKHPNGLGKISNYQIV